MQRLAIHLPILVAVLAVYVWGLDHANEPQARGVAFSALVVGNLALALTEASAGGRLFGRERGVFWIISAIVGAALIVILSAPALSQLFDVARPPVPLLAAGVLAAVVSASWTVALRLRSGLDQGAGVDLRRTNSRLKFARPS